MSKIFLVLNDHLRKPCIFPHTLRGFDTFWKHLDISPSQNANHTKWASYSQIFSVDWVEVLRKTELDHIQLISRRTYITLIWYLDIIHLWVSKHRKPQIPLVNPDYQHQISPNSADTPRGRVRQWDVFIFHERYLHCLIKSADHIRCHWAWKWEIWRSAAVDSAN